MKERLDKLVVSRNICSDIKTAQAIIMSGKVLVDDVPEDKIGTLVDTKSNIRLKNSKKTKYVSRGGLKLEKAIEEFNINVNNKICMDVGCSTGGFTNVLLNKSAKKVFAVDVGVAQLAWSLRTDSRVVVMEKTNIKNIEITSELLNIDFICVDVSFISVTTFTDVLYKLLNTDGELVILIKPQFEADRVDVGVGGIIRDKEVHKNVVDKIISDFSKNGFQNIGIIDSPILGAKGNKEFLAYFKKIN